MWQAVPIAREKMLLPLLSFSRRNYERGGMHIVTRLVKQNMHLKFI
jgi:hypothetical protein